ncbi:MAG: hypothetical protein OHK0022_30090 [Roseiflexaceae bacterium]
MSNTSKSPLLDPVLLVTVTKVETETVMNVFKEHGFTYQRCSLENIYYDFGMIGGKRVWLVRSGMGSMTPGGSSSTVSTALRELPVRSVLMVGIAFGCKPKSQQIGDVLVARQIMCYDSQRISTGPAGEATIVPRGVRVNSSVYWLRRCEDAALHWNRRVDFGLLLSGEKLVDHAPTVARLLQLEPEAIGGDMESTGLYVTSDEHKVDWVVIKAISDWADGRKAKNKDNNQQVAARNAAEFTLHLLTQGTPPPPTPPPPSKLDLMLRIAEDGQRYWLMAEGSLELRMPLDPSFAQLIAGAGRSVDCSADTARALGQELFKHVVRDQIAAHFEELRGRARLLGVPLRLSIALDDTPVLHAAPWELLHDGHTFLALDGVTSVVRRAVSDPPPSLKSGRPLRVLVTSYAADANPALDPTPEALAIRDALYPLQDAATLTVLHGVGFEHLCNDMIYGHRHGQPFHLWHHIDRSRSVGDAISAPDLALRFGRGSQRQNVPLEQIAKLARDCPSLRGILLSAPGWSATTDLGAHLLHLPVPLVLGFCGRIHPDTPRLFAAQFYAALVQGLDRAVANARRTLATRLPETSDWAAPLVVLRSQDAQLITR